MTDTLETGLALFGEVFGQANAQGVAGHLADPGTFAPEQARWAVEWAYGTVWPRPGLDRKLRSCAVIGMLIGQGQLEELKVHTRIGIANGLTRAELEEIVYTAIPYAGFPAANSAKAAMLEALAEMAAEMAAEAAAQTA